MIDIMKHHMPADSGSGKFTSPPSVTLAAAGDNEEKEAPADTAVVSLLGARAGAGFSVSSRRGGMQNAHRTSECVRTGEHLIVVSATREFTGRNVPVVKEGDEDAPEDDPEEEECYEDEECDVDYQGNISTGDISEGEVSQNI
jgi:hypothetical protein